MLRTLLVWSRKHFDSKHHLSFLRILSLYFIYDWITVMGYSCKHEFGTINMLYILPNKIVILHPYLPMMATPPPQPLSSADKVAIVERFDWIIVKFYLPRTVETSWVTVLLVFIPADLEPCFVDIRSRSLSPMKLSSPAISVAGLAVNVIPLNKDASVSLLPLFSPCHRKPKWFM